MSLHLMFAVLDLIYVIAPTVCCFRLYVVHVDYLGPGRNSCDAIDAVFPLASVY